MPPFGCSFLEGHFQHDQHREWSMKCYMVLPVGLAFLAVCLGCGTVHAQALTSYQSKDKPAISNWPAIPTQSQVNDIWRKLVALLSKHDGYVTKQEFEGEFGMQFERAIPDMGRLYHNAHQGKSWLLGASFIDGFHNGDDKPASSTMVYFRDDGPYGVASHNPCLDPKQVFDDLEKSGWKGSYNLNHHFELHAESTNELTRSSPYGYYTARVFALPNCVLEIIVADFGYNFSR
jgi:hypothetical protein